MNSIKRIEFKWRFISSFEYYNEKSNLDILYIFVRYVLHPIFFNININFNFS